MNTRSTTTIESPVQHFLNGIHARYQELQDGSVASYIPELAKADPHQFGICIATCDGHVYEVGDSRQAFTIQSISKALVYGLALEDRGRDEVLRFINVEPSGEAFNSISLEAGSGRPLNPMINAGAIAAASLIAGHDEADKFLRLKLMMSLYAGESLELDEPTFQSEHETGHRNRAIGHMLRNFGIIDADPSAALDLYFKQCSMRVNCRQLAVMAATLANGGLNPVTHERAIREELVGDVLSVMTTCGMYDYAGEWAYRVGMPAKSGVGGGIMAVLPGQLGIGVFSPPLDARGNSVRGVKVCEALSGELSLHFLRPPCSGNSAVHSRKTLRTRRSSRRRSHGEDRILHKRGDDVSIYRLQGELRFSTVEPVIRELCTTHEAVSTAVLDFRQVSQIDSVAGRCLLDAVRELAKHGRQLVLAQLQEHQWFRRYLEEAIGAEPALRRCLQTDLDEVLEWCENQIIFQHTGAESAPDLAGLDQHQLCENLSAADVEHLRRLVQEERYEEGASIIRRGDRADRLYFMIKGEASVYLEVSEGRRKRLATLSPGVGFGEAAFVFGGLRSADVIADGAVLCYSLTHEDFERLAPSHTSLKVGLLQNLLRSATQISNRLIEDVAMVEA